jgi:hypothetical protein
MEQKIIIIKTGKRKNRTIITRKIWHIPGALDLKALILFSHLRLSLPNSLFPSSSQSKIFSTFTSPLRATYPPISSSLILCRNEIWWRVQIVQLRITARSCFHHPVTPVFRRSKCCLSTLFSTTLSVSSFRGVRDWRLVIKLKKLSYLFSSPSAITSKNSLSKY